MPRVEERRWLVVYTKPLNEKKVYERLVQRGAEVYLPLKEEMRQWSEKCVEALGKARSSPRLGDLEFEASVARAVVGRIGR